MKKKLYIKNSYRYSYTKVGPEVRSKCARGKPCQSVFPSIGWAPPEKDTL